MLPRGTHEYEKFIKPSSWRDGFRQAGLEMQETIGMTYNPLTKRYRLTANDVSVNYLISSEAVMPFRPRAVLFDLTAQQ